MTAILKALISAHGFPIEVEDPKRLTFSQAMSILFEYADEWLVRDFILRCVRRGSREPNLTHLIAANLACCGVFNPIITTNFDDLALAAFWQLPVDKAYQEPYVIYDPKTVRLSRVELGEDVPVIIKAHGHHTQYGLGVLDQQLAQFAPGVKRVMRWLKPPQIGYIVVGSSGSFADGVMAALKDRTLTHGKPVYWFFREGLPPELPVPLAELTKVSDVRFVRCDDSDELFLRLWWALDGMVEWLLDSSDLFTPATLSEQMEGAAGGVDEIEWGFNPSPSPGHTREEQRAALRIDALTQSVLPLVHAIDKWDDELLFYDCLPDKQKYLAKHEAAVELNGREPAETEALKKAITWLLPWTRRNRVLLRLALDESTDPLLSQDLLTTIDQIRGARGLGRGKTQRTAEHQ